MRKDILREFLRDFERYSREMKNDFEFFYSSKEDYSKDDIINDIISKEYKNHKIDEEKLNNYSIDYIIFKKSRDNIERERIIRHFNYFYHKNEKIFKINSLDENNLIDLIIDFSFNNNSEYNILIYDNRYSEYLFYKI